MLVALAEQPPKIVVAIAQFSRDLEAAFHIARP
jgi:hypothetical protein